jgi:hypothetical protein
LGFKKNIKILDLKSKNHLINDKINYYKMNYEKIFIVTPFSIKLNMSFDIERIDYIYFHFSTENFPKGINDLFLKIILIK